MSPRSTFSSCGSSSRRVLRRKRPTGVIAAVVLLAPTPRPVAASASCRIDRNLWTVKTRPCWPTRCWRYRPAPDEVSLTASATTAMTGSGEHEPDAGGDEVEQPLAAASRAALPEAGREDQPARPQVLDGDLAGVAPRRPTPGGRRSRPRASSRAACPSAACRAHRPGSRPRGRRCARGRSTGMSSIVPMTPGLITGAPTRAGSGSTNPTISTPSSWRRSNSSRASSTAAGPVPTSSSRSRGATRRVSHSNSQAPAGHEQRCTRTAATTNTPRPMTSAREPEVERRQQERGRAERLDDADEQLAAIARRPGGRTDRRSTGRPGRRTR